MKPNLTPSKQRSVKIKIILAMVTLLLIVPLIMFAASSYFINKGIMMDAYLMSHEYSQAVTDFYKKNGRCPTNQDIKITITSEDTLEQLNLATNTQANTCYIVGTLKSLGTSNDGKRLILSKTFKELPTNNSHWQCFSNASYWYLPKDCNTPLPFTGFILKSLLGWT